MENTEILKPVKVFSPQRFEEYCKRRKVKKITYTCCIEDYDELDFDVPYEIYENSRSYMYPFCVLDAEFTEARGYDGGIDGRLELDGKGCFLSIDDVKKITLYNAFDKADLIMVHVWENEEENRPERVFLFGLQYE